MLLFLLTAALLLASCDEFDSERFEGSGVLVTRTFDLEGFDQVSVSNTFNVEVTRSDTFTVEVTADDNVLERVEVRVRGSTLELQLESGLSLRNATLEAVITMPELVSVEASGASRARFEGFGATARFDARASGASSIRGDIETDDLSADVSGASTVELAGSAATAELEASGASGLELRALEVAVADVRLSGASRADLTVTDELDIDASGASRVSYRGDPGIGRIDLSGGSSVDHDE